MFAYGENLSTMFFIWEYEKILLLLFISINVRTSNCLLLSKVQHNDMYLAQNQIKI